MKKAKVVFGGLLMLALTMFATNNVRANCIICTNSVADAWCWTGGSYSNCQTLVQEGSRDCNRYDTEHGCPPDN